MRFLKFLFFVVVIVAILIGAAFLFIGPDPQYAGDPFDPGEVTATSLPNEAVHERAVRQHEAREGVAEPSEKQILFGDMHVHTTYSVDAFQWSLPIMQGTRGAFPPAYACDYARYVSQLDFYFLTDHAESYTPEHWKDQVESIRQCNAVSAGSGNPDLIAFIGWEWTQIGNTAEEHYGHHNVFFRDIDEGSIPSRPIGSAGETTEAMRSGERRLGLRLFIGDFANRHYYDAFNAFTEEMAATPRCEEGVPSPELPADCYESAKDPAGLFKKLREWDFDTIVAPHGTTWGFYTPPGASWRHQLVKEQFDPELMSLVEVYSGHGNSEQYRDFHVRLFDEEGNAVCPAPTKDYLPSCRQAGEIIKKRCLDEGLDAAACDDRAATARQHYADVDNTAGHRSVIGANALDWLDSGQARDMFLPAFNYRPGKSVQYALAIRNFEDRENPLRYKWGFIASTDNHTARPGTGFKQYDRQQSTEAGGAISAKWRHRIIDDEILIGEPVSESRVVQADETVGHLAFNAMEAERLTSFFTLGGLVAVHAEGRSRDGIWDALKRKEVYGTSGPRILLWFNKTDVDRPQPMGSEVTQTSAPSFEVRAVGSFKQLPGCPDYSVEALEAARLEKMAAGECYNPSDERYLIDRIEVVRILPQIEKGEDVRRLIEDPWKVIECDADPAGCTATFDDPEFIRDTVYYVRAIEEGIPTVNGANLRPAYDENGTAISVNPCFGDYRTGVNENCLATVEHRAWSSPIYVDYGE